jgi:hypothetical protein
MRLTLIIADLARFEEATHRTTRWLDRCIAAHKRPNEQNLFPIVQVRRLAVSYTHVSKRLRSFSCLITALDDFACKTTCMLCWAAMVQAFSEREATAAACQGRACNSLIRFLYVLHFVFLQAGCDVGRIS